MSLTFKSADEHSSETSSAVFNMILFAFFLKFYKVKLAYYFRAASSSGASFFAWQRQARNARDWWWTARDHGKGTDGRFSTSRQLSPSRLPLRAHFHQKRDVWVRGRFQRALDLRTRTTTSTRFNLVFFFRVFSKNILPGKLHGTIFHLKN